jgi:hypothetical protein
MLICQRLRPPCSDDLIATACLGKNANATVWRPINVVQLAQSASRRTATDA